jgi:hypothetical protein
MNPTEQDRGWQDHRQGARQQLALLSLGFAITAFAMVHNATVESVREATDRYLESKSAEHRHEHKQRNGPSRDALILHPCRNERVEGATDEPAQGAAHHGALA